jgi:hypothetical protein
MTRHTLMAGARIAGFLVAAALLAGCYAPLAHQEGYFNLGLQIPRSVTLGGNEVVVLVVDSAYQDAFAEMLNLKEKGRSFGGSLPTADQDRLKALGEQLTTNGLVKFGGFPFYQTTLSGNSGSFEIPGVPAGHSYFVKIIVFNQGVSFSPDKIDQSFYSLILCESLAFASETYMGDTAWMGWQPGPGQPVPVSAGQSTPVDATLVTLNAA